MRSNKYHFYFLFFAAFSFFIHCFLTCDSKLFLCSNSPTSRAMHLSLLIYLSTILIYVLSLVSFCVVAIFLLCSFYAFYLNVNAFFGVLISLSLQLSLSCSYFLHHPDFYILVSILFTSCGLS